MQKEQAIIYARQSQPPVGKKVQQSLLRGSITCGYCGQSLIVFGSEYRCHRPESNEARCGVSIAIDTIDTAVWNEALKQLEGRAIPFFGSDEPTCGENRQVLNMLGIMVILYKENDTAHNRYEIKHSLELL